MREHGLAGVEGYPATSADLNPIENMFGLTKKPGDELQGRLEDCIKNNGGPARF